VSKMHFRVYGSLLLVVVSLGLASLACYSDQVPGLFELTPYSTPTVMPAAADPQFDILSVVLAPQETGRTFFNLTVLPEKIAPSLLNSKSMCDGNSPAQVLFAAEDEAGDVYYLVECAGSVGWAEESRLAGPLILAKDDLAITLLKQGASSVELLDDNFQPMFVFQICEPETIVPVQEIEAADVEGDGIKEIYYRVECPTTGGPLKGWATNDQLAGPVEIDVGDRALALSSPDAEIGAPYLLASEPAPLTEENAVSGECTEGAILEATEAMLVDEDVYYRVTCDEVTGWTDQNRFVGPLKYERDAYTIIYVPARPIFADLLPADLTGEVEDLPGDEVVEPDTDTTDTTDVAQETPLNQRQVVQYTPPLYLTDKPGTAILAGDEANVVGQCVSNSLAHIEDYAGLDQVYYQISCEECTETETDADGLTTCTTYEMRTGWVDQEGLQGPLAFIPGDEVSLQSSSAANETDEEGQQWIRIPATLTGASSIGRFTVFDGRCPAGSVLTVQDVVLERARTSNKFNFFYKVECLGEKATYSEVQEGGVTRPVVNYNIGASESVVGFVLGRDLESVED
jgi:hypothetical protein